MQMIPKQNNWSEVGHADDSKQMIISRSCKDSATEVQQNSAEHHELHWHFICFNHFLDFLYSEKNNRNQQSHARNAPLRSVEVYNLHKITI